MRVDPVENMVQILYHNAPLKIDIVKRSLKKVTHNGFEYHRNMSNVSLIDTRSRKERTLNKIRVFVLVTWSHCVFQVSKGVFLEIFRKLLRRARQFLGSVYMLKTPAYGLIFRWVLSSIHFYILSYVFEHPFKAAEIISICSWSMVEESYIWHQKKNLCVLDFITFYLLGCKAMTIHQKDLHVSFLVRLGPYPNTFLLNNRELHKQTLTWFPLTPDKLRILSSIKLFPFCFSPSIDTNPNSYEEYLCSKAIPVLSSSNLFFMWS